MKKTSKPTKASKTAETSQATKASKTAETSQAADGESKRPSSSATRKVRRSPQEQLLPLLQTDLQKEILLDTIAPMKESYSYDFCIACIAYIRYGIKFSFANKTMQVLFVSYCDLLDT